MSPGEMKADFIRKLDFLRECGINAIIFQVRPEADAWYISQIEPWSRFLTGKQGVAPEPLFDPMAFLIQECHKRNMEFHAWINPFRAGTSGTRHLAETHIYHRHPEWFVIYNQQLLFDPGVPACRQYLCTVVRDIVRRYDVDAIHMDDYFYPYPVAGVPFPDDDSFERYGMHNGWHSTKRADWRRDNVNKLIMSLKKTITETKPWVRFGVSPFGIYRNKKSAKKSPGSDTNGLQNYDDLYADVLLWAKKGWIDYNIPQVYWKIGHPNADYLTLIQWWDRHAHDIPLYIGQDVKVCVEHDELTRKLNTVRGLPHVQGNCFWPANEILWNTGGIADRLKSHYHRYPALIPAYTHMYKRRPRHVYNLEASQTPQGYTLQWKVVGERDAPRSAHYFVVYRFARGEKKNLDDPSKIVAITRYTEYLLPVEEHRGRYTYIVTSVDRFHNESKGRSVVRREL